jgi:formylglycine-generating enzyme required for sulfatase activity
VRISRVARYDESFTPKIRLEPDADTLALYHCDENGGEQLVDSSSQKHHGQIIGPATWLSIDQAAKSEDAPKPAVATFDAAAAKAHQDAWAKHLGVSVESTNSIGMKMILIPPGEFLMGADEADADAAPHEKPQHQVRLTKPFAIGATEVTNRQFHEFVKATQYVTQAESDGQGAFEVHQKIRQPPNTWNSPETRKKSGDNHPVRCVSWEDARRFCEWLTQTEGHTYRLPTEAEWEFACRAGTATRYSFGNNLSDSPTPPGTSGAQLRAVAQLPANPFGLFDMHGNVNEFCLDSGRTFTAEPVTDPRGSLEIDLPAAVRGGAISSNPARLRSSNRYLNDARRFPETNFATTVLGFRVVREIASEEKPE